MKRLSVALLGAVTFFAAPDMRAQLGREVAIQRRLADDEEFQLPLVDLIAYGRKLFLANWTVQDGAGRPLMKGTGRPLSDPTAPLLGTRAFNRISGPDANSCAGCHNQPFGLAGGSGDFVTNVFVMGQQFDFVTFDRQDKTPTRGALDEQARPVSLESVANLRSTPGMFGAGYLEMLAREITADLQTVRDSVRPGQSRHLRSKDIDFGIVARSEDGAWNTAKVTGLSRLSLISPDPHIPPSLIVRPWHQAGNVISLREFSNTAFNQHHGMQSTERFGRDVDPDGDGVVNELTRADITAISVFQATLPVPGRVIPNDPEIEAAVWRGEEVFRTIGCARCHIPSLTLRKGGMIFTEPNPFNAPANLRIGETETLRVDLQSDMLPKPRLSPRKAGAEGIDVPAFTDFKLHDITSGPGDAAVEPIDMNWPSWSPNFRAGNRRFLTRRLWGAGNTPPYFHHGLFTTMREATLAHAGEAKDEQRRFVSSSTSDQDAVIEFLKTLQVLPPGTRELIVDENFRARTWPPAQSQPVFVANK